jgi:GNAT superfamily N-acetyltransferase
MRYSIRLVDAKDPQWYAVISALQLECLPGDTPYDHTIGYWHVAFTEDKKPIAFSGLVPSSRWSDCGYLCRAGVLPDHRGNGLQKRLIRVRIRQAKANGWAWLITDTYKNPPSSNSLISCGFKLFDPTVPWGAKGTLYWRYRIKHALQRPGVA